MKLLKSRDIYFKAHGVNKTVVVNEHLNAKAAVFKPKQNELDNSRNSLLFFAKNTNDNRRQHFGKIFGSKDDTNLMPVLKCWICGGDHLTINFNQRM